MMKTRTHRKFEKGVKKVGIMVHVPKELHARLKARAADEQVSMNLLINRYMNETLSTNLEKRIDDRETVG